MRNSFDKLNKKQVREAYIIYENRYYNENGEYKPEDILKFGDEWEKLMNKRDEKGKQYIRDKYGKEYLEFFEEIDYIDGLKEKYNL